MYRSIQATIAAMAIVAVAPPTAAATYKGKPGQIAYSAPRSDQPNADATRIYLSDLSFDNSRELLLSGDDATEPRHHRDTEVSWAPSGKRFVFERWFGNGPQVYVTTGSLDGARQVPMSGVRNADQPAFGPDGKTVAFVAIGPPPPGDDLVRGDETLMSVRTDGTKLRTIGAFNRPAWTPDGRILAASGDCGTLTLMRADGKKRRTLVKNNARCTKGVSGIDVSPNGKKVLFSMAAGGDRQLHTVGIDGRGLKRITNAGDGVGDGRWAPDGKSISYYQYGTGGGHFRITPSGKRIATLRSDRSTDIAWQPGRR